MRTACTDRNVQALMALYPSVVPTRALNRDDTRRIAQLLHTCVRNEQAARVRAAHVIPFVQQVVHDLQTGTLPPHPYAFVHLLGIYKTCNNYDEGYNLWQWLAQQDDSYVSQAVYGAAIELLTYGSKMELPELESLYVDALKRFPGTFAEYHLSPDAIVPDRSQPVVIANLPVLLLQGILTARLRAGDWKNSYLALDTALRLYPSQLPTRFFELFMTERPLEEQYTVFMLACRGGTVLKPNHVAGLITRVKKAMEASDSLQDRLIFLRAIANAIYAYLEAGGSLEPIHVGQFLTAFDTLLPELAPGTDFQGGMAELRNRIITFAHDVLSSLLQAGMPPSAQALVALVHLAGKLRVPDLLKVSLQDIRTAQVELDSVGIRTVLTAAGQVQEKELIEEYWARIAFETESKGVQIDWRDWIALSKSCKRADHLSFFRAQLTELEHAIPATSKDMLVATLDKQLPFNTRSIELPSAGQFEADLDDLKKQMKNIAAVVMSGQRLDIRHTPFHMFLDPKRPPLGRREDMQTIYDEYTIDPHQPPAATAASTAALSPTGIPLDALRFANWVSIVELMDQADSRPKARQDALKMYNRKPQEAVHLQRDSGYAYNLTLDNLRKHIKRLRDPSGQAPKVASATIRPPSANFEIRKRLSIPKHAAHSLPADQTAGPRITHHTYGRSWAPERQPISPAERQLLEAQGNSHQNIYLSSRQRDSAEAKPSSIGLPELKYYVGLQSSHNAPPPKISPRPLGKPKSPRHHALRLQPTPTPASAVEEQPAKDKSVEQHAQAVDAAHNVSNSS
ncbi:hypothetical protein N0V90_002308 [Kalmusia sp. IMI 367209]|nr:hypothetical protein N0V90_002308 [Kalmusia sp. IMI 367209]